MVCDTCRDYIKEQGKDYPAPMEATSSVQVQQGTTYPAITITLYQCPRCKLVKLETD